jgi:hypothetical protein
MVAAVSRGLRLPWRFLENPLNNAGADAELPADLEDAITISPQLLRSPDANYLPGPDDIYGIHPASTAGKLDLRCSMGMEQSFGP